MKRWTIASVIVGLLGWAQLSQAAVLGTVSVTHPSYFTDGYIHVIGAGINSDGYGGIYTLDIVTPPAPTGEGLLIHPQTLPADASWNHVVAFCTELPQGTHGTTATSYDVIMPAGAPSNGTGILPSGGPMGVDKQNALRELWGRYIDDALSSGANAEVFSACIWEIVYESFPASASDWDITAGPAFIASTLDTTTANTWLHSLLLDGSNMADLRVLTNSSYQDFLVAVPEPASLALLAMGGIALMRRRV